MFGKKNDPVVVVVPATENSAATYSKLLEMLRSPELRDFLRVKIAERASVIPIEVAGGGGTSPRVAMLAGEIKAFQYLIYEASNVIEKMLSEKVKPVETFSPSQRFDSRFENEGVSD